MAGNSQACFTTDARVVKTRLATFAALVALGAAGSDPSAAHEAPQLVEYHASAEYAPRSKGRRADLFAVPSPTLNAIYEDPSAADLRVGMASPDEVLDARALALVLPGTGDAGAERVASFGNLEIEQHAEHEYSIYARSASPPSEVSLVVMGQDVVGTITHGNETFEVRPLGGGRTAVYRRDDSHWSGPECGVVHRPLSIYDYRRKRESAAAASAHDPVPGSPAESHAAPDSGEVIDVLVAYTEGARRGAGNIDALIRQFIGDTNRYYANSRIRPRIRLVHSYQTEYVQDPKMEEDLERFRAQDDGQMDEVHALRNRYGADLAALLVGRRSNYCGYANIYWGSESGAFSITAQSCGSYIFAHEIGHNQGAHHDPGTDTNRGFPYGHGLCNRRNNWRTVMSYNFNNGCWPRAPYFSNPDISYGGVQTGDESTRHNARVLNETAFHVANFRKTPPPQHSIPLVMSADNATQQGFLRVINRSGRAGRVRIDAFDDDGRRYSPVDLRLDARQTRHFNSMDLEDGNSGKGLSRGIGSGSGDWRLHLSTDLDIEARAYVRTNDGFLTSIHEVAAEEDEGSKRYRVPTFNPGSNAAQQSRLRLVNIGGQTASIEISGLDDRGRAPPRGRVRLTLAAGAARTVSAEELERGARGLSGRFGSGTGKWQLSVSADQPLQVMSLLFSRTGNITNLSR